LNKKEVGLVVYGLFLISYFGLGFMAFMADPIQAQIDFETGLPAIMFVVFGFIAYSVLFIHYNKKEEIPA
jgi:hypothetical protein